MTELATTENLLHPRQVSELNETRARLEDMLSAPAFIRNQLQDGGALATKQIRELDKMLEQAPQPLAAGDIDDAVRLEVELRERWLAGMPTHAEMRRNVAGAVDKNMAWERRTKPDVLRWKHLRRRLHASGISEHRLADEGDISNIEMFRPTGGAQELNMHNEQIPGKIMKLPPAGAGLPAVMSEADREVLAEVNPALLDQMGTMTNDQRAEVLALVRKMRELGGTPAGAGEAQAVPSRSPRGRGPGKRAKAAKRPRTEAQKFSDAKASERMKGVNARRHAKKVAEEA